MPTKLCTVCKIEKPISEFHKCKNKRFGVSHQCKECEKIYKQSYHLKHKKEILLFQKEYRETHKEEIKIKSKQHYRDNKLEIREYQLKYRNKPDFKQEDKNRKLKKFFGITLEQYNKMLEEQNGVCAVCGNNEVAFDKRTNKNRSLSVDHNHKTGKIRGLLCSNCNHILGKAKDNIIILQKLIEYLKLKG
jgi:hypothetical protein